MEPPLLTMKPSPPKPSTPTLPRKFSPKNTIADHPQAMKYEITIKEVGQVTQMVKGVWEVVENRPWTAKELHDSAQYSHESDFTDKHPLKEVRAYTPDRETIVNVDKEIYRQSVDELDLAAVIKAVNKLP